MRIKTRELELSKAFDEVFLRLFLLLLRSLQLLSSIPIIGLVAAVISGFANAEVAIPSKASAALAVASTCLIYSGLTILPVFFEGPVFFTTITALDLLFLGGWASLVGVWNGSATGSCRAFVARYFESQLARPSFSTDCRLIKAMFALMIINVALFGTSAIVSFSLRTIELNHMMHWDSLPLFRKAGSRNTTERHCSCCNHNKDNPSPRSSFEENRPRSTF